MKSKFKGDKIGPRRKHTDLSKSETDELAAKVLKKISDNKDEDKDMYYLYLSVLIDSNLMCPHPQHKRSYDGKKSGYPQDSYRWYECEMCECAVFNEDYVDDEEA